MNKEARNFAGDALGFADALADWYWTHGGKRKNAYRLPPAWVAEVYAARDRVAAAQGVLSAPKPTLAVWGPSQSGKSTLLSYFIDSQKAEAPGSALDWDSQRPFRFLQLSGVVGGALNPLNNRGDASGCVSRFYLADAVSRPAQPVNLKLASRVQMLHAVAAGYLQECKLNNAGDVRFWDSIQLGERMQTFDVGAGSAAVPDRAAFELIADCVACCDRLIDDEHERYLNLGKSWARETRRAVLARERASLSQAESFVFDLLWDQSEKITALFRKIEAYRIRISREFDGATIYCSMPVASLMLDIESYKHLAGGADVDPARTAEISRLAARIGYRREGDDIVIDIDLEGSVALCAGPEDYGLFQSLVWELAIPLSSRFLKARTPEIHQFLECMDVLDVPGVARLQRGISEALLDLVSDPDIDTTKLLTTVVKRGKTGSIISRYAYLTGIDALLLLNVAGDPPSQPTQLIGGINALWRGADPGYEAQGGRQHPVPIAICLTFIAPLINEMAQTGCFDIAPLVSMLSSLGSAAEPGLSQLFVTTYPHLSRGAYDARAPLELRRDKILPELLKQKFIQKRFASEAERDSIRAALLDDDGGVSHLLRSLGALRLGSRETNAQTRLSEAANTLLQLAREAAPRQGDETEARRAAIEKLMTGIETRLDVIGRESWSVAQDISNALRTAMTVEVQDLQMPPRVMQGNRFEVADYLNNELGSWTQRPHALTALSQLGLSLPEAALILRTLQASINVEAVAIWCAQTHDPQASGRKREHFKRYIAAKLMREMEGDVNSGGTTSGAVPIDEDVEGKLQAWAEGTLSARSSPHYEMIIQRRLALLTRMAKSNLHQTWEPQPGDGEIRRLLSDIESWS